MRESEIKTDICKALTRAGALAVVAWQGPLAIKGVSDLLVCHRGRFIAIEVKQPGGKVTPEQASFLKKVEAAGGIGFVAHNVEDVVTRLGLGEELYPLWFDKTGERQPERGFTRIGTLKR